MPYSKTSDIFIHVFAGLAFLALPLLFMSGQPNGGLGGMALSIGYWIFCVTYIIIFYLNTYILIPRLYFRKKYLFYFIAIIILFILVFEGRPFEQMLQHHMHHRSAPPPDMFNSARGVYDDGP